MVYGFANRGGASMRRTSRWAVAVLLFGGGGCLFVVGCTRAADSVGTSTTATTTVAWTTITPSSTTASPAPSLTRDQTLRLQVMAMLRACGPDCPADPVCVFKDQPSDFVAAVEDAFPGGVMMLDGGPSLNTTPRPDCLELFPDDSLDRRSDTVVGVGIWHWGAKSTKWFRWTGSDWTAITPEEAGVTDTTWVS
jgi:hypothetical protein